MKWLLCELILSCSLAAEPMSLDELTYRTVLFDYYQESYDDALVRTLVAESQGRTGDDPTRFTLAKGSFAFKDGMYGYSREIFDGVAQTELTDVDRLRLAFHLARVHHQRQDWQSLGRELDVISRIEPLLEEPLAHPEVTFMRVEYALAQQDIPAVRNALELLPSTDPLYAYALYNLGVLQREMGASVDARQTFEQLTSLDAREVDSFDLVQRAKLALAFMARENEQTHDAKTLLEALPGTGRYRDVALASYGNLAMQREENELAARIWLTLQQDEGWTASATAARLGFPMSLQSVASPEMVLTHYQAAERGYETRLMSLGALVQRADDPLWIRELTQGFARASEDEEALKSLLESWESDIGHREWVEWLADESAHKLLRQWRELDDMKGYLAELPQTLSGFEQVAHEQRRRATQAKSMLKDDGLLQRRAMLEQAVGGLASQLDVLSRPDQPRDRAWYSAIADEQERALLRKLWDLQDGFESALPNEEGDRWQARVTRLLGVVYYDLATTFAGRHWAMIKRTQELEAALLELDGRVARVESAEEHFVQGAGANFEVYADRAVHIIERVDGALANREQALAGLIRTRMEDEAERVQRYLFVTRIAIARATDELAMAVIEGDE